MGPAVGEVARRLGRPFMPWQQHVADVVLEVDPITGRLVYDEFTLAVPRQSGKSTFILAKAVHRATATGFFGVRQRLVYTAQTRNKAREKWEEDYAGDLRRSRTWGRTTRPHFGNGNEHIRFPNGSRFGIEANTEKAGHGGTLDEAYIDEAFAQVDTRLEQAFGPAMITRPNTQLGIVSTAGWLDGSPYLLDKVQRGRELVGLGVREGSAFFEWSAEEDADPEDPATWWSCMPALGLVRADGSGITEEAIASEFRKRELSDFRRAYLNQWVLRDAPEESLIDLAQWAALENVPDEHPTRIAVAVAGSADREWSYLGLAGVRGDGRVHVQVVKSNRGTDWVLEELVRFRREFAPQAVAVGGSDPVASLVPEMKNTRGLRNVLVMSTKDEARAAGMFLDAVKAGGLSHAGGRLMNLSVEHARLRPSGEFAGPKDGSTDIAPLKAVSNALFALKSKRQTSSTETRRAVVM